MKSKKIRHEDFCIALENLVEKYPFEFEGRTWLAVSQDSLAEHFDISIATLKRYIMQGPVVRKWTVGDEGQRCTLLRIGEPDPPTHREIGNTLAAIYRQETRRKVTPHEAGCLTGLAGVWPEGHQKEILRHLLKDWSGYMSYVGCYIDEQNAKSGSEAFVKRYLTYPSLTVLRRFPEPAVILYLDHLQNSQKTVPEAIKAFFPVVYPKKVA